MAEDYHKMWADLGLDLEKHDQLLGILNEFYPLFSCSSPTARPGWGTSIS